MPEKESRDYTSYIYPDKITPTKSHCEVGKMKTQAELENEFVKREWYERGRKLKLRQGHQFIRKNTHTHTQMRMEEKTDNDNEKQTFIYHFPIYDSSQFTGHRYH